MALALPAAIIEHHHLQRVGGEHIAHVATLGASMPRQQVQVQGGDIQAAHEAAEGIGESRLLPAAWTASSKAFMGCR